MKDRAQLKREYKENSPPMGIFAIRNKINQKMFLVSCLNLTGIMNRHRLELQMGSHRNKDLLKEWKEFGEDNFAFEVLDRLEPREGIQGDYKGEIKVLEKMWLDKLQPYGEKGYHKEE
jgi:hypothetical protein